MKNSINLNIIGTFPQIFQTEKNVFNSVFFPTKVIYGEIPEEIPYLELEFNIKAKKTDLLSTTSPYFGLIVNRKLKSVILNFHLPSHKFYTFVLLENKAKTEDYYWFNFYDDIFQYIDMEKSKFRMKRRDVVEEFSFTSKDFFLSKNKETFEDFEKTLKITEIHLLETFPKYDIFAFEGKTLISERLLSALQENNITGYEVSEYDILKME
ncbi:hypothetical protein ACI76O_11530 [Capnocytophaga cynodegmi]